MIIEKQIDYEKNRNNSNIKYRLIRNTRRRMYHAVNGRSKLSSTRNILGIDIITYKRWIEFQMTPEMNWSNIEIDQVKPICMFDVSNEQELKEVFSWKITQPLLKHDHQHKGIKFDLLDYQKQFTEANQFIKSNEEVLNQNTHR